MIQRRRAGELWLPIAVAAWIGASATVATSPAVRLQWTAETPKLEAFAALRTDPKLCGLALDEWHWSLTGGYTYLHRPVPIYMPRDGAELRATSASFNTILGPVHAADIPAEFSEMRCFTANSHFPEHAACLYRRPGPCDPRSAAPIEINHNLRHIDL